MKGVINVCAAGKLLENSFTKNMDKIFLEEIDALENTFQMKVA